MTEKLVFKPRARLILQLGEQLIRNESIALLELVKNAYDADASQVRVIMKNIDKPGDGLIIVEDDGCGMTMEIIKNEWMEPGSDYKENLFKQKKRTAKYGRLPLGEKGIGRFAAHKLGSYITLISRAEDNPEIVVNIDWTEFEKSRYLEEVPIKIIDRSAEYFAIRSGTRIEIRKLRTRWTRGMMREVYRSLVSFTSPFDTPESFKVILKTDKEEWVKDLLKIEDVKNYALFRFKCIMEGNHIKEFLYNFTPWNSMKKIDGRTVDETDTYIQKRLLLVDREGEINLNKSKVGIVIFEGFIFDLDPKILGLGVPDKKTLREYLKINGGIRIYRDGIRIYDYGEPGNDWLDLGIRRVNEPTKRISNNIIVAAVHLDREKSTDLREKTNREGFIENEAFSELKRALLYCIGQIEELRYEDKEKIRVAYGLKSMKEPVIAGITELKEVLNKKIREEKLKKDIFRYLDRIENEYKSMRDILLRGAGAGLTLSVVIHEIEKIISELKKVVKIEVTTERIKSLVEHLAKLIEGYTLVIKKSEVKKWNLRKLIDQSIFNMEYRFKVHDIEVIKAYESKVNDIFIKCSRNLFINSLINIMDNSIWWLEYKYRGKKFKKEIFVDVSDYLIDGYLSIIIADNGPGLTLSPDEITRPFVSAKPDGMGLGLHIVDEVMKAHGGFLKFPEYDEVNIGEDFKDGAIVLLAFKKEEEKL
ncbi:histidine kinase [Caldithrix abyssi DSM 13497]|uniref:histidine kinase n=1 Tax=Caldithrix abyssi DSM 13497 TaxID=880073 RepID=H1XUR9_CALAY|nr:sensor histidine kinase [Caldithrix abyssi]APF17522.1 Histidine kinase-, DNA gyrase B-, and HSP90-like ATPase [Caldithrix abyssi DSM 13497]EHO41618.1 histidine kinase [Caldithrix abyssi DSM 13497]